MAEYKVQWSVTDWLENILFTPISPCHISAYTPAPSKILCGSYFLVILRLSPFFVDLFYVSPSLLLNYQTRVFNGVLLQISEFPWWHLSMFEYVCTVVLIIFGIWHFHGTQNNLVINLAVDMSLNMIMVSHLVIYVGAGPSLPPPHPSSLSFLCQVSYLSN